MSRKNVASIRSATKLVRTSMALATMDSLDRLDDAAPVLAYLATSGDFGALAVTTLVAGAAARIAARAGPASDRARRLDVHQALEHMRDVLDRLDDR